MHGRKSNSETPLGKRFCAARRARETWLRRSAFSMTTVSTGALFAGPFRGKQPFWRRSGFHANQQCRTLAAPSISFTSLIANASGVRDFATLDIQQGQLVKSTGLNLVQ